MKYFQILLFWILLLTVGCGGPDLSSPESAFTAWRSAVLEKDGPTAQELSTEDFLPRTDTLLKALTRNESLANALNEFRPQISWQDFRFLKESLSKAPSETRASQASDQRKPSNHVPVANARNALPKERLQQYPEGHITRRSIDYLNVPGEKTRRMTFKSYTKSMVGKRPYANETEIIKQILNGKSILSLTCERIYVEGQMTQCILTTDTNGLIGQTAIDLDLLTRRGSIISETEGSRSTLFLVVDARKDASDETETRRIPLASMLKSGKKWKTAQLLSAQYDDTVTGFKSFRKRPNNADYEL